MVTGAAADQMWAVAIHVKVGLNQARRGERDHQFVAVAKMKRRGSQRQGALRRHAPPLAFVPPKASLVEQLNEFNLEFEKSLILGTRSLLSGQKLPCSSSQGNSQVITAAQGFFGLRAILKRVTAKRSLLISLIAGILPRKLESRSA